MHSVRAFIITIVRLLAALMLFNISTVGAAAASAPPVLGWLEWAWLGPAHVKIKTKLDTGAKTSSLAAEAIETFDRGDVTWVRFRVPLGKRPDDSDHGRDLYFERPVTRMTRVKDHVRDPTTRYVVDLELCIANIRFTTPVTLADRSSFNYPLLLGRLALQGRALVDAARKFTASRSCAAAPTP